MSIEEEKGQEVTMGEWRRRIKWVGEVKQENEHGLQER